MADWAERHKVALDFIPKGKPTQNAFIERFNGTYRTEVLDFYIFESISEVRQITDQWLKQYNEERPHESLGDIPLYRDMNFTLWRNSSTREPNFDPLTGGHNL